MVKNPMTDKLSEITQGLIDEIWSNGSGNMVTKTAFYDYIYEALCIAYKLNEDEQE